MSKPNRGIDQQGLLIQHELDNSRCIHQGVLIFIYLLFLSPRRRAFLYGNSNSFAFIL
jgi:hypothetical protein